jgi:tetratricopeptide (TPR) repeat protein
MALNQRPPDLRELETTGLIRRIYDQPDVEFQFRHSLVHEAAYSMLTRVQRKELHQRVGETLEALYPDRLDEMADLLARHFAVAGRAGEAVQYARRAARRAASTHAYDEASDHLEGALELIRAGGPTPLRRSLQEELGDLYKLCRLGGKAIAAFQAALADWESDPEPAPQALLGLHRKILQTVADLKWAVDEEEFLAARQIGQNSRLRLKEGLQGAVGARPNLETARHLAVLSVDAWRTLVPPDWEAARRYAEEACEIAERIADPVEISAALGALSQAYVGQGLLREHLQAARRRLEITEDPAFEDLRERVDSLREVGLAHLTLGDYTGALPYLDRAQELAAKISAVDQQFNALALQAQCWLRLDRWDDVLAVEERWRELARGYTREQTGPTCFAVALSACVRALRGERELAESLRHESVDIMVAVSGPDTAWDRNQHY